MKGPCTVNNYLAVLASKLTQYDQAQSRREMKHGRVNIYRLGHLMGAAQRVRKNVAKMGGRSDEAALAALQRAMHAEFEMGFSPINAVERQIAKGTCSLVKK